MINPLDYKKTGIFIEEQYTGVNNVVAPTAPSVHFVPGFSKKSTVFNRPVLINSTEDRKRYFGDIDRTAEKKGSFFHRTIDVALQTAPVYAMNLLKTNEFDTLEYASLSLSSQYNNNDIDVSRYDNYFNKTGFWQRDTESFLFFAKDPEKKLHITNVGNKNITVFMFKSSDPSLNITAEEFYGTKKEEVPSWINPKSLMNDFLIRVLVVVGDYTNYAQLSVDTTFYKYFSTSGLRKNKVNDFARDRAVTLLGDYTGSVIPYFQDISGRNLFIESLINNESDKTGLFAAMDIDSIETDYPTGVIDLIGETLVGLDNSKINFLSYKDTILETDTYEEIDTDNHLAKTIVGGLQITVYPATDNTENAPNLAVTPLTSDVNINWVYINGVKVLLSLGTTFTTNQYTATPIGTAGTFKRIDLVYVDNAGVINVKIGQESANPVNPGAPTGSYPLFYMETEFIIGTSKTTTYKDVFNRPITSVYTGFTLVNIPDDTGSAPTDFITKDTTNVNSVKLIFKTPKIPANTNYAEYFTNIIYNDMIDNISQSYSYIEETNGDKRYISKSVVVNTITNTEKTIELTYDDSIAFSDFYYTDKNAGSITGSSSTVEGFSTDIVNNGSTHAIIGKQSEMYLDFVDGMINSKDYFFTSYGDMSVNFVQITDLLTPLDMGNYMIVTSGDVSNLGITDGPIDKTYILPQYREESIKFDYAFDSASSVGTALGLSAGDLALRTQDVIIPTNNLITYEVLDANVRFYLKMWINDNNFYCDFYEDNLLTMKYNPSNPYKHLADNIKVYSGESNYTQTLEIMSHNAYTNSDTKFLIDMNRYNEVKINDYVAAYYDINELEPGEQPKKFARILKKTAWSENSLYNTSFAEITVDVKYYAKNITNGVSQTTRYTNIENYVDTYKGIYLNGFKVQQTSLPDGTEARQKEITSIIGKETPLYYAIVNKQKFNFRYLIDSFGLGLTEFAKQDFMDIVGKRKNSIAFLNAPSAKMFKQSTNPYFINDDGTLNMEFVKRGGDEEKNPSFLYSFGQGSGKDDGRDCSGYFFPYVTVNDNGRPLSFPPAAYVANTYMRKNGSIVSGKYNFTVAAGVTDGLILGIANTEMDFTEKDYESADAMGLNLLSYNSNYGFYIETEYTASISPRTALSNLHTRELLVDMENEMYAMLFKYQYQFNIPSIRAKIKREADDICQKYYDRGGITYFVNVIDETNNTPELIDNQFGLLETTIIPVSAMAKIVNVFNITNNGAIAGSTGFGA